jgi:hypothetical protein
LTKTTVLRCRSQSPLSRKARLPPATPGGALSCTVPPDRPPRDAHPLGDLRVGQLRVAVPVRVRRARRARVQLAKLRQPVLVGAVGGGDDPGADLGCNRRGHWGYPLARIRHAIVRPASPPPPGVARLAQPPPPLAALDLAAAVYARLVSCHAAVPAR